MPKQSYDRKSLKMTDVIKKVAFRNRISHKVKFNHSEMASNIELSFFEMINRGVIKISTQPRQNSKF